MNNIDKITKRVLEVTGSTLFENTIKEINGREYAFEICGSNGCFCPCLMIRIEGEDVLLNSSITLEWVRDMVAINKIDISDL